MPFHGSKNPTSKSISESPVISTGPHSAVWRNQLSREASTVRWCANEGLRCSKQRDSNVSFYEFLLCRAETVTMENPKIPWRLPQVN